MKHSIKKFVTVLFVVLAAPLAMSQHMCTSASTSRVIELEDSSKNESIKVDVPAESTCLVIGLNSTITNGALTMEIYDPKGDKQGNFSVEGEMNARSSNASKKDMVCGQLNKTFKEPMTGEWTIKLKPKKVTGEIKVSSHQAHGVSN